MGTPTRPQDVGPFVSPSWYMVPVDVQHMLKALKALFNNWSRQIPKINLRGPDLLERERTTPLQKRKAHSC